MMRIWLCADMTHHSACLEINVTYLISVKKYYSCQSLFTCPHTTLECGKKGPRHESKVPASCISTSWQKKKANLLKFPQMQNVVVLTLLLVFSFCSPNHKSEQCNVDEDPQPAVRNDNISCLTSNISQAATQLTKTIFFHPHSNLISKD